MDNEEPAQMPTVEEVRAWRASQMEAARRGIMVNPSGAGAGRLFRMTEAEKHYEAIGLL
jgi:hypothetical protein